MRGRLVKNLYLVEADLEAKQLQGICKAKRNVLESSLYVGNKGSIIHEEKILDPLLGLCVGLEAP